MSTDEQMPTDEQTEGQTNGRSDGQTQVKTIPLGHNGPGVTNDATKLIPSRCQNNVIKYQEDVKMMLTKCQKMHHAPKSCITMLSRH